MKKLLIATAVASALAAPNVVFAQAAAAAAPASPHTFTANVAFVTDYRFRAISQTFNQPAIQGGFDYSHSSGLYAGTWASNVYGGNNASGLGLNYFNGGEEIDVYGGYKWNYGGDLALDAGVLTYNYPGAKWGVATRDSYNNTELYLGGTYKWFSAKYNYATTDYFGTKTNTMSGACGVSSSGAVTTTCAPVNAGGSKGSGYLDLGATYDLGNGFNLIGHVGKLSVKNYALMNYTDYKIGLTKDWAGVTWGAAYIDSNAKADAYRTVKTEGGVGNIVVKDTSAGALVLSVSKTF